MIKKLSLTLTAMVAAFFVVILCVKFGALLLGFKAFDSLAAFVTILVAARFGVFFARVAYEELDRPTP